MVLMKRPTQAVVVMMMMMMVVVVVVRRIWKRLLATSQGRGSTVDQLQSQHIYNKQHTAFSFLFLFLIFFLFPLADIRVWFETKD